MHQRGFVYRLHIYPKFIDSINSVIIPVHTKQLSSNDMLHPHHRYKHLKDIIYIYMWDPYVQSGFTLRNGLF